MLAAKELSTFRQCLHGEEGQLWCGRHPSMDQKRAMLGAASSPRKLDACRACKRGARGPRRPACWLRAGRSAPAQPLCPKCRLLWQPVQALQRVPLKAQRGDQGGHAGDQGVGLRFNSRGQGVVIVIVYVRGRP